MKPTIKFIGRFVEYNIAKDVVHVLYRLRVGDERLEYMHFCDEMPGAHLLRLLDEEAARSFDRALAKLWAK